MANPLIERFRGQCPKCRWCGRALRPNYKTVTRPFNEKGKYKKVWLGTVDKNQEYADDPDRDHMAFDPPWAFSYDFDPEKGQYFRLQEVGKIKSRKFLGTFGARGDNLFCMTECGYQWAARYLTRIG
jgi:hypothetical protein